MIVASSTANATAGTACQDETRLSAALLVVADPLGALPVDEAVDEDEAVTFDDEMATKVEELVQEGGVMVWFVKVTSAH